MLTLAASEAAGGWVGEFVTSWGYAAVLLLLIVENLFPPIPSELILPLAGYYVEQGNLSFAGVLVASTAGSVGGAVMLYYLGQLAGRPVLERWGHLARLHQRDLDRADEWFARYGPWVVFFGRLVPGVRSIVSIPAGASSMPMGRFLVLTTAGSLIWNMLLVGAGWLLGSRWEQVTAPIDSASSVVVVVFGAALVGGVGLLLWRRRGSAARNDP